MAPPREARHGRSTVDNHMPESPRHRQSPDDSRAFSVGLPWRQVLLSPIVRSSRTSFLVAILVSFLFAAMPSTNAIREPVVPPRTVVDVPPGGDLQQALDQAQPGDTIQLAAGAAYTGPFTLPTKSGSAFIVIRTSTPDSALPPPGTRIRTSDVPRLARVDASGGSAFAGSRRGIAMNGVNLAVYDSILADFKEVGADSQALAGWSGAGPFTIVNNELDGAGENLMFGGADPSVPGLVPADIVVRHNHFFKPLSWKVDDPSYAGTHWSVKNLFELKDARRVLVEGNVFENDWTDAQTATALLFTVRNQDGTAPWSQIDHVTFRDNIVRHAGSGLSVLGYDDNFPSQQTNNVTIENNLLYDLNASTWGGFGAFVLMLNGTADVAIEHNTVFQSQHVLLADLLPNTGFVFANNIAPHNLYGVFGSGRASGNDSLDAYFPGSLFRRNVIPGAPASSYPTDNFYPAGLGDVGFVDFSGGNYRLAASSAYKGAA